MNPDTFNMSLRKFLKRVGVTSQRELEQAVQQALDRGELRGDEDLPVRVELRVESLGLVHRLEDELRLE